MIKVFSPRNEVELAIARSILDAECINYYIKNEHFGSLYAGVAVSFFNEKTIYVREELKDRALDVLENLIR